MKYLQSGKFFGDTFNALSVKGITLTETIYTHEWVDWHYHENAYFTYLLEGKMVEGSKKEKNICSRGTLLYHNCQESHYNIKPPGFTKGFHIEISAEWTKEQKLSGGIEGKCRVSQPQTLHNIQKIYSEFRSNCTDSGSAIEELLVDTFGILEKTGSGINNPAWLKEVIKIIETRFTENLSLNELSQFAGVHPVHLSRDFKKHFGCNVTSYIRRCRLELALKLISAKNRSLAQIAAECGFADQSHFIKWFKKTAGYTPNSFRSGFPDA